MFHQVPVLPVVVPLAGLVLGLVIWHLRRAGRLTAARAGVALVLCVYLGGVVANTLFPIYLDKPTGDSSWTDHLVLVPLVDYEVADALMNTAVFLPVGVLIPLLLARPRWWHVVALSAAFSAVIEVGQLVSANLLGGGHIADVDDFLFNVAGAVVGGGVLVAAERVPVLGRVLERFRWR